MKASPEPVPLRAAGKADPVWGTLNEGITPKQLKQYTDLWLPAMKAMKAPDCHWEWEKFYKKYRTLPNMRFYSIDCDGSVQGLMFFEQVFHRSWADRKKEIIYIEYLSVAPWNRNRRGIIPRFKPVGTLLFAQAMVASFRLGFMGRVGLHSLPTSVSWYRNKLKLHPHGFDHDPKKKMEYFELKEARAAEIVKELEIII